MKIIFGRRNKIVPANSSYKIWLKHFNNGSGFPGLIKDGNHPVQLTKPKFTRQKLDYLHFNPVAEEIVDEPENYLYSSARDYYTNRKGYLDIDFIE